MSNKDKGLEEFRKRLAELKEERRLSLATMSNLCGIPKSTLDGYLKGVSPTLENLVKLSEGLEVSLNLLVAELDGPAAVTVQQKESLANAVQKSAYDELRSFFQAAVTQPDLEFFEIREGKIGGREPDEIAWQIALYIADNFKGIRTVTDGLD